MQTNLLIEGAAWFSVALIVLTYSSMRKRRYWLGRGMSFGIFLVGLCAQGAVISVTTNDNYTKIESAQSGDEVVISPGTYAFRVYLSRAATNTISIHALDPANPPVWDFGTNFLDNAPGSYTAGDKARGGWQFSGAKNYSISGIVFRNSRNAVTNAGGIRYYN